MNNQASQGFYEDFTEDEQALLQDINKRFIRERKMCMSQFEHEMAKIQEAHQKATTRLRRLHDNGLMNCPECNGTGQIGSVYWNDEKCEHCDGSGEIPKP